jgi:hypothetical protein
MKRCSQCKKVLDLNCFYNDIRANDKLSSVCKQCHNLNNKKSKLKHRKRVQKVALIYSRSHTKEKREYYSNHKNDWKNNRLINQFGITLENYNDLLKKQNYLCLICNKPETEVEPGKSPKTLAVDHNHETGKIRGLLCGKCNKGIGMFEDNTNLLQSAINYLNGNK